MRRAVSGLGGDTGGRTASGGWQVKRDQDQGRDGNEI